MGGMAVFLKRPGRFSWVVVRLAREGGFPGSGMRAGNDEGPLSSRLAFGGTDPDFGNPRGGVSESRYSLAI